MKKVESTILLLTEYFTNKVVTGDYEFIKCSDYTAEIKIDNKYNFSFWIANGVDNFKEWSSGDEFKIINLEFTPDQREATHKKITVFVEEYKTTQLKAEKMAEIEKLQNELEKLTK